MEVTFIDMCILSVLQALFKLFLLIFTTTQWGIIRPILWLENKSSDEIMNGNVDKQGKTYKAGT